jgi:hypothetical protein
MLLQFSQIKAILTASNIAKLQRTKIAKFSTPCFSEFSESSLKKLQKLQEITTNLYRISLEKSGERERGNWKILLMQALHLQYS